MDHNICQKLLDEFFLKDTYFHIDKPCVEDIVNGLTSVEGFHSSTEKKSEKELGKHKLGVYSQISSLSFLALSCCDDDTAPILRSDHPANDIQLMSHLINIANTENAIYKLCRLGFDSQARILLRDLDERLMQVVVLFSNSEDFEKWQIAEGVAESKQAHYEVFSRKNALLKKYGKIEQDILGYGSGELEAREFRKEELEKLSMSVHGASDEIAMSAWRESSESDREDRMVPNLLGGFSLRSCGTVLETFFRVWYFLKLFRLVLIKHHNWEQDFSDHNILAFEFYRFVSHKIISEWVENQT
ncbi:MAG: hypothetical protein KUG81_08540 [Gammaproteobacteria bacterium]|nr:hypothetical protein [Gammaproteobacteria bacterium]